MCIEYKKKITDKGHAVVAKGYRGELLSEEDIANLRSYIASCYTSNGIHTGARSIGFEMEIISVLILPMIY